MNYNVINYLHERINHGRKSGEIQGAKVGPTPKFLVANQTIFGHHRARHVGFLEFEMAAIYRRVFCAIFGR